MKITNEQLDKIGEILEGVRNPNTAASRWLVANLCVDNQPDQLLRLLKWSMEATCEAWEVIRPGETFRIGLSRDDVTIRRLSCIYEDSGPTTQFELDELEEIIADAPDGLSWLIDTIQEMRETSTSLRQRVDKLVSATTKPLVRGWLFTVHVLVDAERSGIDNVAGACDWVSCLLSDNNDILEWCYLPNKEGDYPPPREVWITPDEDQQDAAFRGLVEGYPEGD